ncbi:hypothetical protein FJT64_027763 [Amphibalanus amphitrite]|uniref:Uncharacterized protein n=1 Tax=Amphibalanus amphitrite TaxID=1232801 RepID=A0A6A4W2J1_AMPAM|nr:hypothetical protein FJT64_027763 [Amphibalanus amphitrite]
MLDNLVSQGARPPASIFVDAQLSEQQLTAELGVLDRPLLLALQSDRAECEFCSPLGRLHIQSCSLSGSSLEGLMGLPRLGTGVTSSRGSDTDIMVQLGPVRWGGITTLGLESEATDEADNKSSGEQDGDLKPPRLAIELTENPGFVLLMQEKESWM